MSEDILLSEVEGWWCLECESVVSVHLGEEVGLSCGCIGFIAPVEEIPSKWIQCRVKVEGEFKLDSSNVTNLTKSKIELLLAESNVLKLKSNMCIKNALNLI